MKKSKSSGDFFTISSARTGLYKNLDGRANPCDLIGCLFYGDLAICVENERIEYIKIITKFGLGFIIPDYSRYKSTKP